MPRTTNHTTHTLIETNTTQTSDMDIDNDSTDETITFASGDTPSMDADSNRKHKKTKTKHNPPRVYKKVNAKTTNRRERYIHGNDSDESDQTTQGNNTTTPTHTNVTRVALKLTIPATKNSDKAVLSMFKEFISELISSDDTAQVYPWFSKHDKNQNRIKSTSEAPKAVSTFRMYANKVFIGDSNKVLTIYPNVRIGHEKPLKDIRRDMRNWLMEGNHGVFYKMLQAESSSEIGWLLYSTRDMDQGALADEMSDILGFNLGLRWKVIDIGVRGKIPESQKVMALSVEVEQHRRQEYQRKLIAMYGRQVKDVHEYPNGVRLRFVKQKSDCYNTNEKGKIDRLRQRQQLFNKSIQRTQTWEIMLLDHSVKPGEQPTLRQMIMEINSRKYPGTPLFHSVDLDKQGSGFVFQFSAAMKDEAECMVNCLLPYLDYQYPEADVSSFFTDSAAGRCTYLQYNPDTGMVEDKEFKSSNEDDLDNEELKGFEFDFSAMEATLEEKRPLKDKAHPSPYDIDSVPTIHAHDKHTLHGSRFIVTSPTRSLPKRPNVSDTDSVYSSTSTVTMATLASMESKINTLTTQLQQTDNKFEQILGLLHQTTNESTATVPTEQANSPTVADIEAGGGNSSGNEL
jgi:hypothetical protein